jgi:hypothetical protein
MQISGARIIYGLTGIDHRIEITDCLIVESFSIGNFRLIIFNRRH